MRWFHRPLFRELIVPELGDRYVAEYFWECTPVPASEPFRPPRLDRPPDDWRPDGFDEESFILVNPTSGLAPEELAARVLGADVGNLA